jgi:hypothetical protein
MKRLEIIQLRTVDGNRELQLETLINEVDGEAKKQTIMSRNAGYTT